MSLVYSCIAPHSPITLPTVGDEKQSQIQHTLDTFKDIEGELYVMQPDTLIVISPHAPISEEAFSVHLATQFTANFQEFGDQDTKLHFMPDVELVSKVRENADQGDSPVSVNIIDQSELDYGSAVTLFHLTQHVPNIKIMPVSVSMRSLADHFAFGRLLRNVASDSNKRIAIIASTDLSHTDAPEGLTFDTKIQEMIRNNTIDDITKLNPELIELAQASNAARTLAVLFGALHNLAAESSVQSYERPFGVGLLVAQFNLI